MRLGIFRGSDLEQIQQAVAEAENRTAGEIVTYIVGECDRYPEATWRGAAAGALLATVAAALLHAFGGFWGAPLWLWSVAPALLGLLFGAQLAEQVPWLRRRLISKTEIERRTTLRAEAAFLEEEVFKTRDRTGILLFLAIFEHRAIVLGDEGINRQVEEGAWQRIIDDLVAGIREGKAPSAVVAAIDACGELLEERDVTLRPDDEDELPDAPRIRER